MAGKNKGGSPQAGGFKARDVVQQISYDFNPYANEKGAIEEPSTDQVVEYRNAIGEAIKELGLDPEDFTSGGATLGIDKFAEVLESAGSLEATMLEATAELTGLDLDMLQGLPYRVSRAFAGYIMGAFFSPEA